MKLKPLKRDGSLIDSGTENATRHPQPRTQRLRAFALLSHPRDARASCDHHARVGKPRRPSRVPAGSLRGDAVSGDSLVTRFVCVACATRIHRQARRSQARVQ
jgi:hypothetical protein